MTEPKRDHEPFDRRALAEIPPIAAELERELDRVMDHMTSRGEFISRQIAAGALARCRAVIEGIRLLADQRPDLCGLLLRNLSEAFVVGVLALYDDEALRGMAAHHQKFVKLLNDRNELGLDELLRSTPEFEGGFVMEQATKRAGELLHEHGEDSADLSTLYDLLYRGESTFGGHGWGLAVPYIDGRAEPLRLVPRPGSINVARSEIHVGLGCIYTCFLARHVLRAFGISAEEIEAIGDRLGGILAPEEA
jgi:hypothetical protein